MNRRRAAVIVFAVLFVAAAAAAFFIYRGNSIGREIRAIAAAIEAVDNIAYGKISYNPVTDIVTVSDALITLSNNRGTVSIDDVSFTDARRSDLHDAHLYGITYNTNNSYDGVLTVNELELKRFNPESFVSFFTDTKGAADYTLFPTWLSSPFDMESCEFKGLSYSQPSLTVGMEHFIWTGPLRAGQTPEKLRVDIDNATFNISGSAIELPRDTYTVKSLTYIREYNKSAGIYKESYQNIILENLFTLNASHELQNFDADTIIQAVKDGYSVSDVILSTAEIKKSEFRYDDHSFIKALMASAQSLVDINIKLLLQQWIQNELPAVLSNINERKAISDAALVFLENPRTLVMETSPSEPVPFSGINDPVQFNRLNMVLKVNDLVPIEIHMVN